MCKKQSACGRIDIMNVTISVTHPQSQPHSAHGRPLADVGPQASLQVGPRHRLRSADPGRRPEQRARGARRRGALDLLRKPLLPPGGMVDQKCAKVPPVGCGKRETMNLTCNLPFLRTSLWTTQSCAVPAHWPY